MKLRHKLKHKLNQKPDHKRQQSPVRFPGGQGGTTLVELVVCAALLGIFCVALVALIGPCSRMFLQMQNLNRGQTIAGIIADDLRRETLHAEGPVRFATAGVAAGAEGAVFGPGSPEEWNAIEFLTENGNVELIDAGVVPTTALYKKTEQVGTVDPKTDARLGTLHMRYYSGYTIEENRLQYAFRQQDNGGYIARAYADAHADEFYMGNRIELKFSDRVLGNDGQNLVSVTVEVTVKDATGAKIGSRRAVLDFDNQPRLAPQGG